MPCRPTSEPQGLASVRRHLWDPDTQDRIDAWKEAVIGCLGFGEIGEIALKIKNRNREIDYRGERDAGVVFEGVLQAIQPLATLRLWPGRQQHFLAGRLMPAPMLVSTVQSPEVVDGFYTYVFSTVQAAAQGANRIVFVSNPLLELEHELAIPKRVSGHTPAQSLKHESQSLWSSLEAGRVHLGNPIESA